MKAVLRPDDRRSEGQEAVTAGEVKRGLPPIARPDARLLVLGSLPGEASLRASAYYAHSRNHFWRLMEDVVEAPLAGLPYGERLERLMEAGVALWDVIETAQRQGSLDQQLREVEARDLHRFAAGLPRLRAIAFNGSTAARLGRRAIGATPLTLVDLPSSSPANTLGFERKRERWAALRELLID